MGGLLEECARGLLDTAPQIMKSIRTEMRSWRTPDLSVPQFRSLAFVHRDPHASLSDLADHLGLTLPSASKLVDGLVKQGLITRQESSVDRRCLTLALTGQGEALLSAARQGTQAHLTKILRQLAPAELALVSRAIKLLQPLFAMETESAERRN